MEKKDLTVWTDGGCEEERAEMQVMVVKQIDKLPLEWTIPFIHHTIGPTNTHISSSVNAHKSKPSREEDQLVIHDNEANVLQFTREEVQYGIQRLASGKSMDTGGLYAELISWSGPVVWETMWTLLNSALRNGLETDWFISKAVMIFKKGDKKDLNNYRLIMVNNIFAKLLGTILEKKLGSWAEQNNLRALSQVGFRQHHSTVDHLVTLKYCIDQAKVQNRRVFICFVDFSKAYNSVDRLKLWQRLQDISTPHNLLQVIKKLYEAVLIHIQNEDTTSHSTLHSNVGVKQGCPLSPTLFGIFIDSLEEWLREIPEKHVLIIRGLAIRLLLFADDVALISKSPQGLQMMLDALDRFCAFIGMRVNTTKTKVMVCGTRCQDFTFYLGSQQLEMVTSYKYLGLECSKDYKWNECITQRVINGTKSFYALKDKCKKEDIWAWDIRRHLFRSVVQPVLLYGCAVWGPTMSDKLWDKIEKVQKQFLLNEFRVKQNTSYHILLLEANILPIEAEALCQFISYTQKLQLSADEKYSRAVLQATQDSGWYHLGKKWLNKWDIQETDCRNLGKGIRRMVRKKVLDKFWKNTEGKKISIWRRSGVGWITTPNI